MGARGGAGATTLVVALARNLKDRGHRVNAIDPEITTFLDAGDLVDADPEFVLGSLCRHQVSDDRFLRRSDRILVLVPLEVQAIANAARLLTELEMFASCHLVVRSPGPAPLAPDKVEKLLKIPLIAVIKNDPKIAIAGEHGLLTKEILKAPAEQILPALAFS